MPGKLFLLVGNSGTGKDSLLSVLKNEAAGELRLVFPKRWITRCQEDPNETYFPISLSEFVEKIKAGDFFVWWEAYQYLYGIDQEIQTQLIAGANVVLNVSRKVIPELRQRYPDTVVIQIKVAPEKAVERLAKRARGEASEIQLRVSRADAFKDFQDWDICFNNDGDLQSRGQKFTGLFRELLTTPIRSIRCE
jgi:ribose 1,5-bisphosphokinase